MEKKETKIVVDKKETKKKKGMNLPNKITCARLVISLIVLVILCFPWDAVGISEAERTVGPLFGVQAIDLKYIVAGVLFVIGATTDFLDGYLARKHNIVTDFGKVMDAIADKVLVNGVLIVLAYDGMLPLVVPVIIITRDIVVDSIKMASGNKGKVVAASWPGKIKTICMLIGVSLTFFYNMPFAFIGEGIAVDSLFIFVAVIMSIYSACQYYWVNKDLLFSEM
ncbi:MAG: CDP-diacylglycerol--glycerol-3-phosphate 3-phosphatidyltransferase [Bacilli bacterium]|nr:CDP-diacylglycerol--glycerol-3-phosphate 3-phosphatidyltransferase [Bacillota bacterium]MBR6820935.1 CDP-diacylglycerol--glycerol-3-phosphate 3-phosphatidyltransferase [Bacilli bacterium]